MKAYQGDRIGHAVLVTVDGRPLNSRTDLWNHSPSGFEWGYCGSGPAQLALAILADHLGNDQEALNLYQRFKWQVVAGFPFRGWKLSSAEIDEAIEDIQLAAIEGAST